MMRETVEERAGEAFRAEDRGPLIERQVAGDERGATVGTTDPRAYLGLITSSGCIPVMAGAAA